MNLEDLKARQMAVLKNIRSLARELEYKYNPECHEHFRKLLVERIEESYEIDGQIYSLELENHLRSLSN